jgi:ssDNA-binding Zn-finger/Zn-ribbon topoisomerase 1
MIEDNDFENGRESRFYRCLNCGECEWIGKVTKHEYHRVESNGKGSLFGEYIAPESDSDWIGIGCY